MVALIKGWRSLQIVLLMLALPGALQHPESPPDESLLEEVRGLSELPLDKLLHVKHTFSQDAAEEELYEDDAEDEYSGAQMSPEALPLKSSSRRRTHPISRGSYEEADSGGHVSKGGGSGGEANTAAIFQGTVAALAFLAFGGYLACIVVQSIRANNMNMNMNAMPAPASSPAIMVMTPETLSMIGGGGGGGGGAMLPSGMLPGGMLNVPGGNLPGGGFNFPNVNLPPGGDINLPMFPGMGGGGRRRKRRSSGGSTATPEGGKTMPPGQENWSNITGDRVEDMYHALALLSEGYSRYHEMYYR